MGKIEIVMICTGNICRSPMAEGILRAKLQTSPFLSVSSAGTHALTGNPAAEFSVIAAMEEGIDIRGHRARPLDRELICRADMLFCMEPSHEEWVLSVESSAYGKVYNLMDYSGRPERGGMIADPYGCSLREYRRCFRTIDKCLARFAKLLGEAGVSDSFTDPLELRDIIRIGHSQR